MTFIFKTQTTVHFLNEDDIVFCKSYGNYSEINCNNGEKIVVSTMLRILSEKMKQHGFIRISRSIILNRTFIRKICKKSKRIILLDGQMFDIPKSQMHKLIRQLENLNTLKEVSI